MKTMRERFCAHGVGERPPSWRALSKRDQALDLDQSEGTDCGLVRVDSARLGRSQSRHPRYGFAGRFRRAAARHPGMVSMQH